MGRKLGAKEHKQCSCARVHEIPLTSNKKHSFFSNGTASRPMISLTSTHKIIFYYFFSLFTFSSLFDGVGARSTVGLDGVNGEYLSSLPPGKLRDEDDFEFLPTPSKQCGRFLRMKHQHRVFRGQKSCFPRLPAGMAENWNETSIPAGFRWNSSLISSQLFRTAFLKDFFFSLSPKTHFLRLSF